MAIRTPMSVQDALWLTMDRPNNLMIIDGVLILATNPGYRAVLDVVSRRVSGRFPVYRRLPVRDGAGWAWLDDPDFDPARHVKQVRLDPPADIPALQRFVSEQRARSLPRSRPLWVMYFVDGVRLDDGTQGSAIVVRSHHAIADGVRITQVMFSMCDAEQPVVEALVSARPGDGAGTLPIALPAPVATAVGLAADTVSAVGDSATGLGKLVARSTVRAGSAVAGAAGRAATDPAAAGLALVGALTATPGLLRAGLRAGSPISAANNLGVVLRPSRLVDALTALGGQHNRAVNDVASVGKLLLSSSPETVWSGKPDVRKAVAWSAPMSLAEVKAVSRRQGATVNDVLLAAVAGGLRRYLALHDARSAEIQWMVPVNLKPFADNLPEELGNYFALVMLPMPLGEADPAERIRQVKARMDRIKRSDEAALTFGLQRVISMAPGKVPFALTNFFANKTVGVLTNVPGPGGLLRFGGSTVVQIVGFAPCSGDQPMTATIFSYNGEVTVGFATDAGLVPDPEVLVALVAEETAAMRSLLPGGTAIRESRRRRTARPEVSPAPPELTPAVP